MADQIKDDEIQQYKYHLIKQNLSSNTIAQYVKYLNAYVKQFKELPIGDEAEIFNNIENFVIATKKGKPVKSTKVQTLKAVCSYRQFKDLPRGELVKMYSSINDEAKADAQVRNAKLNVTLPTLKEHSDFVDTLYDLTDLEKIRAYVINKMIMNCFVRNRDLVAKIITKKGQLKDVKDTDNYIRILKNHVTYVRRNYKTVDTYGEKVDEDCFGKNERTKFVRALRAVVRLSGDRNLIPEKASEGNLADFVIKNTNGLGETKLLKMSLRSKNTLAEATKIGEKRGTALTTLQQNYNLVE